MTDQDIIDRVGVLLGVKRTSTRRNLRHSKWKPSYIVRVRGNRAVEIMALVRPWMGERRQGQIEEAVAGYTPWRRQLSVAAKLDIVRRFRNGERAVNIANDYGVHRLTVNTVVRKAA